MPPTARTRAQVFHATPTFPLLPELRTKILLEVLKSQTRLPFYIRHAPTLPVVPIMPILNNLMLAKRFSALCLVSKQMREDGVQSMEFGS